MNFHPQGWRDAERKMHGYTLLALFFFLCFIVVAFLQGCANTGQAIKAGYGVADSYTVRTTNLLQADLITADEAKKRSALLKQAKQALDTAKNAWAECATSMPATSGVPPCDQARVSLDAANALLAQVETWLIEQEKGKK